MKYTYLLALAGVAVAASTGFSQTTSVPIVNNSFDSSSQTTGQGVQPVGWTTNTGGIVSTYSGGFSGGDGPNHVEDFSWSVTGTGATSIEQTLTTSFVAGDTYTLTALAAYNNSNQPLLAGSYFFLTSSAAAFTSTATVDASASITGAGTTMTTFTISGYTPTVADVGLPIEVGFYSPNQTYGGQSTAEIDDFALTVTTPAVPEPSSIAIAALGGFGLLGLVRRRRA